MNGPIYLSSDHSSGEGESTEINAIAAKSPTFLRRSRPNKKPAPGPTPSVPFLSAKLKLPPILPAELPLPTVFAIKPFVHHAAHSLCRASCAHGRRSPSSPGQLVCLLAAGARHRPWLPVSGIPLPSLHAAAVAIRLLLQVQLRSRAAQPAAQRRLGGDRR